MAEKCFPTLQELRGFGIDGDIWRKFINGEIGEVNLNRKGIDVETLLTWKEQVMEIARQAANMQTYLTKAEMEAAGPQPKGTVAQVTNDPAPANNGYWVSDGSQWIWSGTQPASRADVDDLRARDSLTVNRGNVYPLRAEVRDGVVSPATAGSVKYWNNVILNVSVSGSSEQLRGKVFRITNIDNGAAGRRGIRLAEYPSETYATASVETPIHERTDGNYAYGAEFGISTVVIEPTKRPGMRFEITIDGSQLPAYGTPMNANQAGFPAWSWIIDPSRVQEDAALTYDSLTINSGKNPPLRPAIRAGVLSPANEAFNATLLDARIIGADLSRVYRIAYFVNEDETLGGAQPWGWVLESYDAAAYPTSDASRTLLHNYTDPAPTINRAGGIQTIRIPTAADPNTIFEITLDAAKLPPSGTPIRSLTAVQVNARSWVVDQNGYVPNYRPKPEGGLLVGLSGGELTFAFASKSDAYKWSFGPVGANSLPNIKAIARATGTDLDFSTWTAVGTYSTDWLPPLIFQNSSLPVRAGLPFTGGNHLIDGLTTAQNVLYTVSPNGRLESDYEGRARYIDIEIVNGVMAGNDVASREIRALQKFWIRIHESGAVFVRCRVQALIDLLFQRDYGPQLVSSGFNESVMIAGGQQGERIQWVENLSSGPSSAYPNACALTLRSAANGQLSSWIDRQFGADGRSIDPAQQLVRGGSGTTKMYQLAVASSDGMPMPAGSFYEWRGGYHLSSARADTGQIDSVIDQGDDFFAVFTDGSYV